MPAVLPSVCVPQIGRPVLLNSDGVKPPWNQPQVSPLVLSRSPMFLPVSSAVTPPGASAPEPGRVVLDNGVLAFEHSLKYGSASPLSVPSTTLVLVPPSAAAPLVSPLTTLIAPGDDGPNCVS